MSSTTAVIMQPIQERPPLLRGNVAVAFCLVALLTEGAAAFARWRLFGSADAATAASNILSHLPLFRMLFVADVISASCLIGVTFLLHDMLKPVNERLSILAAFFSLTRSAIVVFASLFQLAALMVLKGAQYLNILSVKMLPVLALTCLKLRSQAYNISLAVLAIYCLLIVTMLLQRRAAA